MPLSMPTSTPVYALVTRPKAQADAFGALLDARFGAAVRVVISPLMEIVPLPVEVDFDAFDAVVFTSQNGVAAYAALQGPRGKRAYCVGDRTADAARAIGLDAVSANGDVSALNALLAGKTDAENMLHLSGKHVAGKVAGNVTRLVAYEQSPLELSADAKQLLAKPVDIVVTHFSPNSVRWFEAQLPADFQARLYAVCMSKAVGEAASLSHYRNVRFTGPPTVNGMLDKMSDFFPLRPA